MPIYDYTVTANGKRMAELIIDDDFIVHHFAKNGYIITLREVNNEVEVTISNGINDYIMSKDLLFTRSLSNVNFFIQHIKKQFKIMEENDN